MNAELAELTKEIGRIANTHKDNTKWYKIADFCDILPIFEEPESDALNYRQYLCYRVLTVWRRLGHRKDGCGHDAGH